MSVFSARCTNCGVELEVPTEYAGQAIACPQCSAEFVASPIAAPQTQAPVAPSGRPSGPKSIKKQKSSLPSKRSYPALKTVQLAYTIMAYLTVVVALIATGLQVYAMINAKVGIPTILMVILLYVFTTVFSFVSLRAAAEFVKLALDIQHNTLVSARNSER